MADSASPPSAAPAHTRAVGAARRQDAGEDFYESIKDTLVSLTLAFILAFTFRAYIVEAFVIPTGSMAPTLLGQHAPVTCGQCGYRFAVEPGKPAEGRSRHATCPMCHYPNTLPVRIGQAPRGPMNIVESAAGDRILVQKFVYWFGDPRRWDVVVFKNPRRPHQNYIKRVVGRPNEELWLVEGRVYTRPLDAEGNPLEDDFRIARKTDPQENPHWERIQRMLWQPVYHSEYVPLQPEKAQEPGQWVWSLPWQADQPEAWDFRGAAGYRLEAESGSLRFDWDHARDRGDWVWHPYNQLHANTRFGSPPRDPIEDLRLAATFRAERDGLAVRLRLGARLDDQLDDIQRQAMVPVAAYVGPDGAAALKRQDEQTGQWHVLEGSEGHYVDVGAFRAGRSRRVELWSVDQELLMWVDGRCVNRYPIELSWSTVRQRRPLTWEDTVEAGIEVEGGPATLFSVHLDRDIYYTSVRHPPETTGRVGTGAMAKVGAEQRGEPVRLGRDLYFCLGDNSPLSDDSRFWGAGELDPWVRRQYLTDPDGSMLTAYNEGAGVVPRRMIMGRAFFVYFPAALPARRDGWRIFPNFGDMRFIR